MKKTKMEDLLRATFEVAKRSQKNGNLPYGCILVDEHGNIIMEGENSVITEKDSLSDAVRVDDERHASVAHDRQSQFSFPNSVTNYVLTQ